MTDPKPRPHHTLYISALRKMTPDQRLRKALELTEMGRRVFADGLRALHPELSDEDLRRLYLERLSRCHNRNY